MRLMIIAALFAASCSPVLKALEVVRSKALQIVETNDEALCSALADSARTYHFCNPKAPKVEMTTDPAQLKQWIRNNRQESYSSRSLRVTYSVDCYSGGSNSYSYVRCYSRLR